MAETKKMPSTFVNMVLVLTVVCVVSALALGFTYSKTKDAIAQGKVDKVLKALKIVLPEFDNNPYEMKYTSKDFPGLEFYPALKNQESVGTAVKSFSSQGFGSDDIWIIVGFDKNNVINKISVLSHKETAGLGSKMSDLKFRGQFSGKNPATDQLKVKKDGGRVDAITAATISSRAFCDAVDKAYRALSAGGDK